MVARFVGCCLAHSVSGPRLTLITENKSVSISRVSALLGTSWIRAARNLVGWSVRSLLMFRRACVDLSTFWLSNLSCMIDGCVMLVLSVCWMCMGPEAEAD